MSLLVEYSEEVSENQLNVAKRVREWIQNCDTPLDAFSVIDSEEGRQMLIDTIKYSKCDIPVLALDNNIAHVITFIHHSIDRCTHQMVALIMSKNDVDVDDMDQVRKMLPRVPGILQADPQYVEINDKYKQVIRFMSQTHDNLYPDRVGMFPQIYGRSMEIINEIREREKMRNVLHSVFGDADEHDDELNDEHDHEDVFIPPSNRVLQ